MNNEEVRVAMFESHFTVAEIAGEIGIHPNSLSRWLRNELNAVQKSIVLNAIQRLKEKM